MWVNMTIHTEFPLYGAELIQLATTEMASFLPFQLLTGTSGVNSSWYLCIPGLVGMNHRNLPIHENSFPGQGAEGQLLDITF